MTRDAMAEEVPGEGGDSPAEDRVVVELERAIELFLLVKRRYPLLMATASELAVVRTLPNERPFANGAVLQVLRDSFDMLVIDLFSIRQRLVKGEGIFALLRDDPERLHVREPAVADADLKRIVAGQIREAARWLTQVDEPATAGTVSALCGRFIKETLPLDRDRNQVRAHRFEHEGRDTSKLFIELPALQGQIDVVGAYLKTLYLVVTHHGHSMDLNFGDPNGFAKDFADLIVHGSINGAVEYYGLAKETPDNPRPWYWYARRETMKRLGHETAD